MRLSTLPLPPYRYVPGLHPHPFRHVDGHMYTDGCAPKEEPWSPQTDAQSDERFLYGVDLFNYRYFWEAHEAWESMWHFADDGSQIKDLLQSLIQCAASVLQHHMGRNSIATHLLRRANQRMEPWSEHGRSFAYGVRFSEVHADTAAFLAGSAWPILHVSLA